MTVTVSGVNATAAATVGAAQIGVAAFDSDSFTVTNGFVELTASGIGISSILTDSGAPAVTHTAGGVVSFLSGEGIDITGQGPGTTVTVSGTYATSVLKGIAAFDPADFTVTAGVVALNSAGVASTITGNSGGALAPTAGNWNIVGGTSAAGTTPVATSGAVSTLTINVQTSQAIAGADATKIGLCNFDSSSFAVAATGFVTLSTTGAGKTITGNSGGAISPSSNNWNLVGSGDIAVAGAGSTLTISSPLEVTSTLVLTDEAITRGDGGVRGIQTSLMSITDAGVCNGCTQMNIENIRIDGNSITSTDVNGAINLNPNGSGAVSMTRALVGGLSTYLNWNTDNTNTASAALYQALVGGASGGDPYITFGVESTRAYAVGIDNTDSDILKFVTTAGASLTNPSDGTSLFQVTSAGAFDILVGDLRVVRSSSGAVVTSETNNSSNTAGSDAMFLSTVAGSSGGDAYTRYIISGGQAWAAGLDNSDSDAYVISSNTAPGTSNVMRVATTGEINFPLQSAFSAYLGSVLTDVTGDGTAQQLGTGTALTEVFDQNGDFNTNGTYTAPVTARVQLNGLVLLQQVAATNTTIIQIITSNRNYSCGNTGTAFTGNMPLAFSVLADMDAADTATCQCNAGGGAKTVDVYGAADFRTGFSGYIAC